MSNLLLLFNYILNLNVRTLQALKFQISLSHESLEIELLHIIDNKVFKNKDKTQTIISLIIHYYNL